MIDRRELLKYFGIGSAIVPIVGGVPEIEAKAKLIEVPKVELAEPGEVVSYLEQPHHYSILTGGEFDITLTVKNSNGEVHTMRSKAFYLDICNRCPQLLDVTTHSNPYRQFELSPEQETTITFKSMGQSKVVRG